jgi:hypothetical protein
VDCRVPMLMTGGDDPMAILDDAGESGRVRSACGFFYGGNLMSRMWISIIEI